MTRRGTRGSGKVRKALQAVVGTWDRPGRSVRSAGMRKQESKKTKKRGKRGGSGSERAHGNPREYWWGQLR